MGLQIEARGITNWDKDHKSGKNGLKSGQGLQIGEKGITNWGKRDYKLGQRLQIGVEQMHNTDDFCNISSQAQK